MGSGIALPAWSANGSLTPFRLFKMPRDRTCLVQFAGVMNRAQRCVFAAPGPVQEYQLSRPFPPQRELSVPTAVRSSSLAELSKRSVLLAALVEAASRRRDVREVRAQIVLLLLALRCPLASTPGKPWYVQGAVARLGAEGLLRAWIGYFGEEGPCLRSMRSHLGCLEQSGILQRSPGDWLPWRRDEAHPERRPRWPDTFHVLDGEKATEYWAGPGARLLELNPAARHSPDAWRKLFARWRSDFVQHVLALTGESAPASPRRAAANSEEGAAVRARGTALARSLVRARGPCDVLSAVAAAGAELRGPASFQAAGNLRRLRAAAAMLARALCRGDRVRCGGGWLWRAFTDASRKEEQDALRWLGDPT